MVLDVGRSPAGDARRRIDPAKVKGKESLAALPPQVNWVADNYNHLHEQPMVFYALCVYSFLGA